MSEEKIISKEHFLPINFNLPDHSYELNKAIDVLDKINNRFNIMITQRSIDDKSHEIMYEEIMRVLFYIGNLSDPAFKIEDQLRDMYILKFPKQPHLAKQLWLDHFEYIHQPYNHLKNRCFRMLDELDACYFKKFKRKPKNLNR